MLFTSNVLDLIHSEVVNLVFQIFYMLINKGDACFVKH